MNISTAEGIKMGTKTTQNTHQNKISDKGDNPSHNPVSKQEYFRNADQRTRDQWVGKMV